MFEKVLSKDAKKSLAVLGESGFLKDAYLAGGTALALQIGHRYSYDFDFFTPQKFHEEILLQKIITKFKNFKLERKESQTILGYIGEVRFSLFYYNYPLIYRTQNFNGINIADIRDITPIKISAIADSGTKRNFIDLYFILAVDKLFSMSEALKLYDRKFKKLKQNKLHILKSLVYFDDAENNEMPKMIKPVKWEKVKEFFIVESKKASCRHTAQAMQGSSSIPLCSHTCSLSAFLLI